MDMIWKNADGTAGIIETDALRALIGWIEQRDALLVDGDA